MKKLILYAVIAFAGWQYYQQHVAVPQAANPSPMQQYQAPVTAITPSAQRFSCDGRQHCSQMRSRAEAEFFLRNCPNTKMDGDRDGIPCENDSRF